MAAQMRTQEIKCYRHTHRRALPAEAFPAACAQARPCPGTPPETRRRQGFRGRGACARRQSSPISPSLPISPRRELWQEGVVRVKWRFNVSPYDAEGASESQQ